MQESTDEKKQLEEKYVSLESDERKAKFLELLTNALANQLSNPDRTD